MSHRLMATAPCSACFPPEASSQRLSPSPAQFQAPAIPAWVGGPRFGPRETLNEEPLYLDCSRCSRVHYCPNLRAKAHRQVHKTRLRKHATTLRRGPQRREDRLFNCRKALLSKQWAHLDRDGCRRQDMDVRFLVSVPIKSLGTSKLLALLHGSLDILIRSLADQATFELGARIT